MVLIMVLKLISNIRNNSVLIYEEGCPSFIGACLHQFLIIYTNIIFKAAIMRALRSKRKTNLP